MPHVSTLCLLVVTNGGLYDSLIVNSNLSLSSRRLAGAQPIVWFAFHGSLFMHFSAARSRSRRWSRAFALLELPNCTRAAISLIDSVVASIHVIQENVLAPISSAHRVIDGTRIFNPQFAPHGPFLAPLRSKVNTKTNYTMV